MFTPTFFDDMDAIIINDYYRTGERSLVHNWDTAVYDSPGHSVSVIPAPTGSNVYITSSPAPFMGEHVLLVSTVTSVRLSSPSPTSLALLRESYAHCPNHTVSIPFQQPIRQLRQMSLGNIPSILVASGADIYVIPSSNPSDALPLQLEHFVSPQPNMNQHIRDMAVVGNTLAIGCNDAAECSSSTSSGTESVNSVHGRILSQISLLSSNGSQAAASSLAWWTDSNAVLASTVTREDGMLAVIDTRNRQHICAMGRVSNGPIFAHCYVPSHNLLACSSKGEILFYDTRKLLLHCETLSQRCLYASNRSVTYDAIDTCPSQDSCVVDAEMPLREVDWQGAICGKFNERPVPRDIGDMQLWSERYLVCTGEDCISVWDIHSTGQHGNGRYQLAAKRAYYKDFAQDVQKLPSKVFTYASPQEDRLVMVTSDGICEVLSLCTAAAI